MPRRWSIPVKANEPNISHTKWLTWREELSGLEDDIDCCISDGYTRGRISIVMEKSKNKKRLKKNATD